MPDLETDGFTHDGPGTPAQVWASAPQWDEVATLDLVGEDRPDRVVVCAAHPDDESLGAGGVTQQLIAAGVPVSLVLATSGERSHPRSPTTSSTSLATQRRAEADRAWKALGGSADDVSFWGLPDGGLRALEADLTTRLVDALGDARGTLLITPWRRDGHADHDALGRAGLTAAHRCGARLLQYPVWFWHRAQPADAPWPMLRRVRLDAEARAAKAQAAASHRSQVAPLSDRPGDETLLGAGFLRHFAGGSEAFVAEPPEDSALDTLHREHEDPWGTESRWYEERRRDLILAMLPRRGYRRAVDVGCSTGTLTQALARRCREVVAVDRSPEAVAAARARLSGDHTVDVRELDVPAQWPEEGFDLVVVSESGYFLSPRDLDVLVERAAGSLDADGTLVLAHWRHPISGWPLSGAAVHAAFLSSPGVPPVAARYRDRDVEIVIHAARHTLPEPGGSD